MEECWSAATDDRPSTDKVAQVISDEFDSLSSSANGSDVSVLLQDLTQYITKVGDYAVARGGFGEIWRCIYSTDQGLVPVRFQCCFYQPFSR
jgi:hypothetical protein